MVKMLPGIYFGPRNAKNAVTSNGYTEPWPRIEPGNAQAKGDPVDLRSLVRS